MPFQTMTQNDCAWLHDGKVRPQITTQRQEAMSIMVWAAVTKSGRSALVFVTQGVKICQENCPNNIFAGSLLP